MREILVHIGYHKTGTSWLQQFVFTRDSPVFFPLSSKDRGSSTLAHDFVTDEEGYLISPYSNNEATIRAKLHHLLPTGQIPDNKIGLLSWERLSGQPDSAGFDARLIAERVQTIFPLARILIVIREQRSWILSAYFQYLSAGGTHSLRKYLRITDDAYRPSFSPTYGQYHHLIADYQERFGANRVLILPFELFQANKRNYLSQLGQFIGRDIPYKPEAEEIHINSKHHYFATYYFRYLSKLTHSASLNNYSALHNRYSERIGSSARKALQTVVPVRYDQPLLDKLRAEVEDFTAGRYAESNARTQGLTGLNLSQYGYDLPTDNIHNPR